MNKKLSLAFYLPNMSGGGVERMRITLAESFIQRGIDVTFVLNKAEGELIASLPRGAKVVSLDANRTLAALPKLVSFLRKERPDILMSSLGHNNIIALWARRIARVPTALIVCQHNALRNEATAMAGWQYRILPLMYRLFGGWADAILAVSKGVADDMATLARIPRDRISVIYNPVVFPGFSQRADQPVSHPWLDDAAVPVFVGVGRLVAQKDFETLIRAFALAADRTDARLIILGDGPLRDELKVLARTLGIEQRIDFCGYVLNPLPYLRRASAMIMSSRYEGFGNVLVEALACGTPVISTDCPYGPSEILADGKFGPLVPVGDVAKLADAMAGILANRLPSEALRARAHEFSVGRVVDQYVELFSTALSTRSARLSGTRPPVRIADTAGTANDASIAIYLPGLRTGGAEISMINLAKGFATNGAHVTIVVHQLDDSLRDRTADMEIVSLDVKSSITALPRLVRFLRTRKPDILMAAFPHNNIVAVAARLLAGQKTRVVLTEHAPLSVQIRHAKTLRYKVLPLIVPFAYPCADAIVAVSRGVQDDLRRMLPIGGGKVQVIYNPVLPANWNDMANEDIDDDWFGRDDLRIVISAGRLSAEKDFPSLIRAFSHLTEAHPSLRLVILGDGPERPALEQLIAQYGLQDRVRLAGFVQNPYPYLRRSSIFVLSSTFEGFGNVIVEAMACGLKIVSTDCPVGPKEILGDGEYGTLVPVGDVPALVDAIGKAVHDSHAPTQNVEKRAQEFNVEVSVHRYLDLFAGFRRKPV